MANVEISDIRLATDGRAGLHFTAHRKGETHNFVVSREALDDLMKCSTQGDESLMRKAFDAYADRIGAVAAKALAYHYRQPTEDGWIVLQSKDF